MSTERKEKGRAGENLVVDFLLKNEYEILEQNWRYLKSEVDIIALNKQSSEICFVEVKTRKSKDFGNPETFVSKRQQKMIIEAAQAYLIQNNIEEEARFDVAGVILRSNGPGEIDYIKGAFYPTL